MMHLTRNIVRYIRKFAMKVISNTVPIARLFFMYFIITNVSFNLGSLYQSLGLHT